MIIATIVHIDQSFDILNKYNFRLELSKTDQISLDSLISGDDKKRMMLSRFILKLLITNYPEKELNINQLTFDNYGKPSLPGMSVSISHSGEYAAVSISENDKIGIDIQKHEYLELNDYKSFLSEDEMMRIEELNIKEKRLLFYSIWSNKEAIMKADGRGMSIDPKNINLKPNHGLVIDSVETWFSIKCPKIDGYSIALYSNNPKSVYKWIRYNDDILA